ncbi:MAG: ATP-binding cassette domain-containing protein, partial [Alphaproteobacteria bacterium]
MTAISVIIPYYNTVRHVKAALQSVLFQSHPPLEVICVDDGSDDGSGEAIEEAGFGPGAPVRLITQGHRGAATARNAGVAAAKGEWLAFLDADDLWPQDSRAARVAAQGLSGADMVFGKVAQFIDGEARDLDAGMPGRVAGSMLLRRAAFDRVGPFDEVLATAETIDWVARARAATALAAGGIAVSQGSLSLGALAAFFVAASQANGALNGLMVSLPMLLTGHEALNRLVEFRAIGREEAPGGTAEPDLKRPLIMAGVHFSYDGRPILNGIDLSIEPGAITALAALNGEGKTTVLDLALGLNRPVAGQIALGGVDYGALDLSALRRAMGVAPQNPLFFRGTVRENILFGLKVRRIAAAERERRLQRAVDLLGIAALLERKPAQLSGGQKQRVALGRAIVAESQICLMDEPLSNLDAQLRQEMRAEIRNLQRQ